MAFAAELDGNSPKTVAFYTRARIRLRVGPTTPQTRRLQCTIVNLIENPAEDCFCFTGMNLVQHTSFCSQMSGRSTKFLVLFVRGPGII